MKKIMACVGTMLVMAVGAMAAGTVKTPSCGNCGGSPTYSNYGPWQTGQGGEFTLIVVSGADIDLAAYSNFTKNQGGTSPSFQTFCIEENEYIYPNATAGYSISNAADNGGVAGGHPDPISIGTAWLYSQFAHGTLANYNYTNSSPSGGRYTDAALLQQAFWYLENEITVLPAVNKFFDAVLTQFHFTGTAAQQLASARADANGAYGVAALNIFNPTTGQKYQTQLVLVPVPDAGFTLGLLGLGIAGLAIVSRKFRPE